SNCPCQYLPARVWAAALGYWRRAGDHAALAVTIMVSVIVLATLGWQYRLNVWNRAMFDALDGRDAHRALHQALVFFPLITAIVGVNAALTYVKMTLQRRWGAWVNAHGPGPGGPGGRRRQADPRP